jgi:sugar phosphate isomerase/epimerase
VRLADSHGHDEDHWPLGQGRVDFRHLFHRLEQHSQFHGHSMCAFGSPEVLLEGRAYLAQEAAAALR